MPKLLLAVLDGCTPEPLQRAVAAGRAPIIARAIAEGGYSPASAACFPSVTPVCATTLATGVRQDVHRIPSMNWWHRAEERYVEYGSSFQAARRLGIAQQLTDTVYELNGSHLSPQAPTVFERLDDAGVRTAGTTYLVYRGRHEHRIDRTGALNKVAATMFRRPVLGPRELFYADLFASRETNCRSQFGMPGMRDQHAGCVGAHLVEHDLCDFLLLSLPDNDTHSHRHGPDAQVESIAAADRALERVVHAAGGPDRFFAEWALVVAADHAHASVDRTVDVRPALERFGIAGPNGPKRADDVALCPGSRAAMVYVLDPDKRPSLLPGLVEQAGSVPDVDVLAWRAGAAEGAIRTPRGELRFGPAAAGGIADERGGSWHVEGDPGILDLVVRDGTISGDEHPDALGRLWAALTCETSGDLLLSAAPGAEFPDFGGADHVGAGSHGSLHRSDSLGVLVVAGLTEPPRPGVARSIEDVVPMVLHHFGLDPDVRAGAVGLPAGGAGEEAPA